MHCSAQHSLFIYNDEKNKNKTKTSAAPIAPAAEERSTNNPKEFVDE